LNLVFFFEYTRHAQSEIQTLGKTKAFFLIHQKGLIASFQPKLLEFAEVRWNMSENTQIQAIDGDGFNFEWFAWGHVCSGNTF
jgi:hypothetical protein